MFINDKQCCKSNNLILTIFLKTRTNIVDEELVIIPILGDGYEVRILMFRRDGEPDTNSPTIADVLIKACYEATGKLSTMFIHT